MKKPVKTTKAPAAIGPYSQAIIAGQLLFISGQIPLVPESGELVGQDIESQTQRVLENLKGILNSQKLSLQNIVKTTIYLKNMNNFTTVNEIYRKYFTEPFPARAVVEVSDLPKNVEIEIEAIAVTDTP